MTQVAQLGTIFAVGEIPVATIVKVSPHGDWALAVNNETGESVFVHQTNGGRTLEAAWEEDSFPFLTACYRRVPEAGAQIRYSPMQTPKGLRAEVWVTEEEWQRERDGIARARLYCHYFHPNYAAKYLR